MKNTFLIFCVLALLLSCADKKVAEKTEQPNAVEATPKALEQPDVIDKLGSYSKRYKSDIISELYTEVLENDIDLKNLDTEIRDMSFMKEDSLRAYKEFNETNSRYWSAVNNLIRQMSDSTLQQSSTEFFKDLEAKYKKSISKHEAYKDQVEEHRKDLKDQYILMKLFITAPMMMNYQRNEKPDYKSLENVILEYDKLMLKTKDFTEVRK